MKNHKVCETMIVGQSRSCTVTQCPECDTYHLHIGPFSLRLRADMFESVCETLIGIYRERDRQTDNRISNLNRH